MIPNADQVMSSDSQSASRTRAIRGPRDYQSDLSFVIRQLEGFFPSFQRLLRKLENGPNAEAQQELAVLKRSVVDRLLGLFQPIWPILMELEFWHPDLSSQFHRLWLDEPAFQEGAATWLAYLGRLRGLLCEAILAAPTRTTGSTARTRDDSPEHGAFSAPSLRDPSIPVPSEIEPHFTPRELAAQWGLDQSTVRRLFRDEEGVLRIPHLRRRGKRDYVTLRIPASVAARVHERRSRSLFKV